jgi:ATP-dependent protease HslVU (ClpYQ) peptidase subunit
MEKDKPLSVGIAAGCEYGRYAVVACDGTLSFGQQAADVEAPKMRFYAGWTFIFAGNLGSTEQIFEEIRQTVNKAESIEPMSRERIQDTAREAYFQRVDKWNAVRHLAAFNLTMSQFRQSGQKEFGKGLKQDLARTMYEDYINNFSDEMMVVGWGKVPLSLMIYSIGSDGDANHVDDGMFAIGSGRDAAVSTLLLLRHKISATLRSTIYAVAAAKFSSESHGIGEHTTLCVVRKRETGEDDDRKAIIAIEPEEIKSLRAIWEENGRPKTPKEALTFTAKLVERTRDQQLINRQNTEIMMEHLHDATQSTSQTSEPGK